MTVSWDWLEGFLGPQNLWIRTSLPLVRAEMLGAALSSSFLDDACAQKPIDPVLKVEESQK